MALEPDSQKHAAQIDAGTLGRDKGHRFEESLANFINTLGTFAPSRGFVRTHLTVGEPAVALLDYMFDELQQTEPAKVQAWWTGGLATSGKGDRAVGDARIRIDRSKSDVIVQIGKGRSSRLVGVGVKTCNKATPTNAQVYFTTATAFTELVRSRGIPVSSAAEDALKMFCGDVGFRPRDRLPAQSGRVADDRRFFWEEIPKAGRLEWEELLQQHQDEITEALLKYAYSNDRLPPSFILHQRTSYQDPSRVPLALFTVDELLELSRRSGGFSTRAYTVNKGTFKADPAKHHAPRFGFVQFQRGGQKQHPSQLQFNLKAGYFKTADDA